MLKKESKITDHPSAGLESLLLTNQVAGPTVRELLEDLSTRGVRCSVLTGWIDSPAGRELPFKVLPAVALTKSPAWKRIWSWGLFTLQAIVTAIKHRRTPILMATNPPLPMLAMPCLKRLTGLRYVLIILDVYPDIMEQMGLCRPGGLLARLWKRWSRRSMLAAEGVVTLGPHMAETLRGHLRNDEDLPVEIIPNWADTDFIKPLPKADNPFARQHGLVDKFVVIYSGALGATHDTESIIQAARLVQDLPDVQFLIIGSGTRSREVADLVSASGLGNLKLLPLQPLEMLPYSLTAADCSIVSLAKGYKGVSVPSKTYYALAAGSALLAISDSGTELTDLIEQFSCGLHIPPGDPGALAEAIRRLHDDQALLASMKAASRQVAVRDFSRSTATSHYLQYLVKKFS